MRTAGRHVLAISGSLRTASSNTSLLLAAERLAPPGLRIQRFAGMGALPHFNPDLEADLPATVADLRATVDAANGLLISCPEYARGMPGSFKNLLDWLVGSPNFHAKPVAIFNASPRASEAQRSLRLVLTTMSALVIEDASITVDLLTRKLGPGAIVADAGMAAEIATALTNFSEFVAKP